MGKIKTTLETSGEDVKIHSKRVEKIIRQMSIRSTSIDDEVENPVTKLELSLDAIEKGQLETTLVSSVISDLLHPFRVYFFQVVMPTSCSRRLWIKETVYVIPCAAGCTRSGLTSTAAAWGIL